MRVFAFFVCLVGISSFATVEYGGNRYRETNGRVTRFTVDTKGEWVVEGELPSEDQGQTQGFYSLWCAQKDAVCPKTIETRFEQIELQISDHRQAMADARTQNAIRRSEAAIARLEAEKSALESKSEEVAELVEDYLRSKPVFDLTPDASPYQVQTLKIWDSILSSSVKMEKAARSLREHREKRLASYKAFGGPFSCMGLCKGGTRKYVPPGRFSFDQEEACLQELKTQAGCEIVSSFFAPYLDANRISRDTSAYRTTEAYRQVTKMGFYKASTTQHVNVGIPNLARKQGWSVNDTWEVLEQAGIEDRYATNEVTNNIKIFLSSAQSDFCQNGPWAGLGALLYHRNSSDPVSNYEAPFRAQGYFPPASKLEANRDYLSSAGCFDVVKSSEASQLTETHVRNDYNNYVPTQADWNELRGIR